MKLFLFTWFIMLFSIGTMAQTPGSYSVTGKVADETGALIPYASVTIDTLNVSTNTDQEGNYVLANVPPGVYQVTAQSFGFKKQTKTVEIKDKSLTKVDFRLYADVLTLDEVTLTSGSDKTEIEESAQAVTVLETTEARQKSGDLGEVLSQTEGVSVRRAGGLGSNMRFSLNGLTDDQIRFFVDDIPLEFSPYSLGLANIPVNLINRLEVYKGVLPVKFGADALGGGVNVVSDPVPSGFGLDFSYQVGSFNTHRLTFSSSYGKKNKFVQLNSFYDFSANNYKVDVQVPNQLGKLEDVTVRRFHDDYLAYGTNATFGIRDKKIIDELSLTLFYNNLFKEIQHNNVMSGAPYGHVYRRRNSIGSIGKLCFHLSKKLNIENSFGYSKTEREFTDTSAWVYNWRGEQVIRKNNPDASEAGGSFNRKSRLFLWDDNFFLRNNSTFRLNESARITLGIAPTYNFRTGDEKFSGTWDAATTTSKLLTWVNSLAFNWKKVKWENNLFIKHYFQKGEAEEPLPADLGSKTVSRIEGRWGAGNVFVYKLSKKVWVKPSYEYAIRLPRPDEIFGDGAFTADNLELKPENSHNFNFQVDYKTRGAKADWALQSNVFGRIVNDLILFIPNDDRSAVYDNVFSANSYGLELGSKAELFNNKLRLSANTTFQHFYNNSDEGHFSRFKGDRIPNRPWYFANASAGYTFGDLFSKADKLSIFWQLRYIHKYFLTWESLGSLSSKRVIPNQTLQTAGVNYRHIIREKIVNLSFEIQNLTNQKAFDFFGVQRPGRAFFMKITTQI